MWPGYTIFADFRAILTERLSFDEAALTLSIQVIRCWRTKRAPYERQQTEHEQTITLQHGVRGVWNHRFGWTVYGRNRRWRYCSNALSTAVRLECAGIYFTLNYLLINVDERFSLFVLRVWSEEGNFIMAAYLLFFLISFASKIVLYFAHTNEVRKANYYS